MKTRTFRVYGADGHRQRVSFGPSSDYSPRGCHISERNSDLTGTNDYSELIITAATETDCFRALLSQIEDGAFENARTGKITEVVNGAEAHVIEVWCNDGITEEVQLPLDPADYAKKRAELWNSRSSAVE